MRLAAGQRETAGRAPAAIPDPTTPTTIACRKHHRTPAARALVPMRLQQTAEVPQVLHRELVEDRRRNASPTMNPSSTVIPKLIPIPVTS